MAVKTEAFAEFLHHRCLSSDSGVVMSVLRYRPVGFAAFTGALVAFVLAPHPTIFAVGLGLGVFAVLMAVFMVIATALHARQDRGRSRSPAKDQRERRSASAPNAEDQRFAVAGALGEADPRRRSARAGLARCAARPS